MPQSGLSLGLGLPAWFGKLPGTGDFAYRRLDRYFQDAWDEWLQQGLIRLRNQNPDWVTAYLNAPVWFFALGKGLIGMKPWVGVMMPSVDSVGRYFPLTILSNPQDGVMMQGHEMSMEMAQWWGRSARLATAALHNDMDAAGFDAMLQTDFAMPASVGSVQGPMMPSFPLPGSSLWISSDHENGVQAYSIAGLPDEEAFATLFGRDVVDEDDIVTQRRDL
jgi:type VI secretion system protein ImpM